MSYRKLARVPKGLRPKQRSVSMLRCPITGRLLHGDGDNAPQMSVTTTYDKYGNVVHKTVEYHHIATC